ncbi:MAG: class I SAM-dependent methyltransferase [Lachnospiraceae bacterium]|nr:class I SAM-dependent methyltransferase [Lachnospiraceae bacterium]
METYTGFAAVYDMFMDNVPYQEWGTYLINLLRKFGVHSGTVLELGCGTGSMTEILAGSGYDMIGVDISEEMLNIAIEKKDKSGHDILYINQDMRELELYGTVEAVVSICDSMNYITEEEDLLKVFTLVNSYLDEGGIFIFDMNTVHKYEEIGDSIIAENRYNSSFIWENMYDADEMINEYYLTIYMEDNNGKYDRFEEIHYQKAYTVEKVKELIEKSGMEFVTAMEAFTENDVNRNSERMYVVAREIQKGRRKNHE